MLKLAINMLIGDRAKYFMLVCAIAFSSLLMTQQSAIFLGLMRWTTATLRNSQAPVWVVDPNVDQINETKSLRDTDLYRVRSVSGVAWALPFYFSLQQARLYDGRFKSIQLFGVDPATLTGIPPDMLEGSARDLWKSDAVIIDEMGLKKLNKGNPRPLKYGDSFDINDHEVKIVGICRAQASFFGYPFVYTTYNRALEIVPRVRRNLSYILVQPLASISAKELAQRIHEETGLQAYTEKDFFWNTIWWFFRNTGIPISFGLNIILGFIVGLVVSGQTFYTFILENLGNIGALKAMGASKSVLRKMLVLQATTAGFVGYGIGVGLASLFGFFVLQRGNPPFYLTLDVVLFIFFLMLFICAFSAFLGIRKISQLQAYEVFRA